MLGLLISRLEPGDARLSLADATLEGALPGTAWRARDEVDKSHACVLLAELNGEAVGALVAWVVVDEVHLLAVGVATVARRRGVGEALLAGLREVGVGRGCERVLLEVDAANVAARALYRKLGFVELNSRPGYYADGGDALELGWDLGG